MAGFSLRLAKATREERNETKRAHDTKPHATQDAKVAHIVTLRAAPTDPDLVLLCTPPELAQTMGGFGPARYIGNAPPIPGASYVLASDDLPRFRVYAANRSLHIVDARGNSTAERPYGRGAPLPECSHCGQPARRGATLNHCPGCGAPWDAVELGAPYAHNGTGPQITCEECSSSTPAGFVHCVHCGARHA